MQTEEQPEQSTRRLGCSHPRGNLTLCDAAFDGMADVVLDGGEFVPDHGGDLPVLGQQLHGNAHEQDDMGRGRRVAWRGEEVDDGLARCGSGRQSRQAGGAEGLAALAQGLQEQGALVTESSVQSAAANPEVCGAISPMFVAP